MTRLTEDQITQKARAVMYAQPSAPLLEHYRAAIIATLTEYAPHLLPRDPDEELADEFLRGYQRGPDGLRVCVLRLIKHMRESGK